MTNEGYLRTPHVHGDVVVFVSEDDCWSVPLGGGTARRLTAGKGDVTFSRLSPDGSLLAFTSREEHHFEVWVMPSGGATPTRLTYLGHSSNVCGWTPDGDVVFRTDAGLPFTRITELRAIGPDGTRMRTLPYGLASEIAFGPRGSVVLGRNTGDPARWKRYRGGTAGHLWVDAKGAGRFRRILEDLPTDIAHPMWIGDRIYFVSDHEGIGNVYSCRPDGKDLRRHTDHGEYYARFAATDGRTVVYQHAAELWALDVEDDRARRIDVDLASPRAQRNRRFVEPSQFLHSVEVHPKGHSVAIEARGHAYTMALWEGAVREAGGVPGARYRYPAWLPDGERVVVLSDEGGEPGLEVYRSDGARIKRIDDLDLGIVHGLEVNPKRDLVAIVNNRLELILVDLENGKRSVVDRSEHEGIQHLAWSHDGAWLAYSLALTARTQSIKLAEIATSRTHVVSPPAFRDYSPSFDPEGKYLYFLSFRSFDPVYDSYYFDASFPRGSRPYAIALRADVPSPFVPSPRGFGEDDQQGKTDDKKKDAKKDKAGEPLRIDLEGIADRIAAFPVPDGEHGRLVALKGKVVFTSFPITGSLALDWYQGLDVRGSLDVFDFDKQKHEVLAGGVSDFVVSADRSTLVYVAGDRLRALKAGEKPDSQFEHDPPSRQSGWLDLSRIRVAVDPGPEWTQMYGEAWRLQRENFWTRDMSGVDWARVRERYRPLVDKVATRGEFSDLIWEMQGELGTSHAYDTLGDHRKPPPWAMGFLGADISWDERARLWRIDRIVRGDPWDEAKHSPLASLGTAVSEGDTILAVNGRPTDARTPPQALLVHQAGMMVELLVGDARGRKARAVLVKTIRAETPARYREWVSANRARVHEATAGRVGYVHIPDMGPQGYSEFHRTYFSEVERDGLVVDVRFNAGGHVSQLILEKLVRQRVGYDVPRWGKPEPYPADSVLGPIVAITNEHAGSDGDIFTHCFKLMEIGPVVGKRTWGGVVGIWPRYALSDGGVVTQPEMAFWFTDVGWGVENYGTDPDYDVDIAPQDYAAGRDPQMEKALSLIKDALRRKSPSLPDFSKRPRLALPKLPRRR